VRVRAFFQQFDQPAELAVDLAELEGGKFGGVSQPLRRALGFARAGSAA
jgi:hypothetical protein